MEAGNRNGPAAIRARMIPNVGIPANHMPTRPALMWICSATATLGKSRES